MASIAGIGFEAKYTILALGLTFLLGLALTPSRRFLGSRGPWIAVGIAALLAAPNLAWQLAHGWPSLHFLSSQNAATAEDTSRVEYLAEQLLFLGAALLLAVAGVVRLWRDPRLRALALVPMFVAVLFLIERGRGYYPIPADVLAIAAGAVAAEHWLGRGGRRRILGDRRPCGRSNRSPRARRSGRRPDPADADDDRRWHLGILLLQGRDRVA